MKKILIIAALVLPLSACNWFEPTVETTKPIHAQELIDSLTYHKARNGLCFGVATTSRVNTSGHLAFNNHIVNVPCDRVGL